MNKTKKEIEIEVIEPKEKHDFGDLLDAPFDMMKYTKKQDRLLIDYREQEIQLLKEILKELQELNRKGDK